jgi:hypothetical protein
MDKLPEIQIEEIKNYLLSLAREDGGFDAASDKDYRGIADSKVSDLAATVYTAEIALTMGFDLPRPEKTAEYIMKRQRPEGNFRPLEDYGLDEQAQKTHSFYNTCMGLRGLKALGKSPQYDPRPFLERMIREEFKPGVFAPPYAPCMTANCYASLGEKMPKDCEDKLAGFLLGTQDKETGWFIQPRQKDWGYPFERNNPFTFHAARFFHLSGRETPMADKILGTFLKAQEPDGSWKLGYVHGTFDAIVTLRILSDNPEKYKAALRRGALWALTCMRSDKGFNHFNDGKPSEVDACYFHIATLVMAGMIPTKLSAENRWIGWGHTLLRGK